MLIDSFEYQSLGFFWLPTQIAIAVIVLLGIAIGTSMLFDKKANLGEKLSGFFGSIGISLIFSVMGAFIVLLLTSVVHSGFENDHRASETAKVLYDNGFTEVDVQLDWRDQLGDWEAVKDGQWVKGTVTDDLGTITLYEKETPNV